MNNRKTIYTSIRQLLLLFFILLMPSCECGGLTGPNEGPRQEPEKPKKTVVVLLHGVGVPGNLDPVKTKLAADLSDKKNVTVIAPARTNSITASIEAQVDDLYAMLQTDHKDSNLIIYGHSQGAVLAAYLWCKHGNNLKIKGLILDRGPLAGFDPLSSGNTDKTTQLVNFLTSPFAAALIPADLQVLINNFNQPGIQNLAPDNQVIQDIVSKLPSIDIPVLLITAEGKFLEALETQLKSKLSTLVILSLKDLFGDPNDGLISLQSQYCKGASNANIEKSKYSFDDPDIFAHGLLLTAITVTEGKSPYATFLAKVKSCIKD